MPVDFFGERTRMPAGPAMLAALTGADLLRVHLTFTDTGWHQLICPPLAAAWRATGPAGPRRAPSCWPTATPSGIEAEPADWHMMQPLWEADLPAERRAELDKTDAARPTPTGRRR